MHPSRLVLCLLAILLAGTAGAAEPPKRKSGLWEVRTQMSGMPSQGPMQMCIDQTSDNLMHDRKDGSKLADCPVMQVQPGAGKVTVHSVCHHNGTTATTDAVITGDFDKSYRNDMLTRFSPPQNGMKEMKMVQEARWLGPCKEGQRPGDIILPGVGKMNMGDMMNDPQIREMMKRQQQGR